MGERTQIKGYYNKTFILKETANSIVNRPDNYYFCVDPLEELPASLFAQLSVEGKGKKKLFLVSFKRTSF